MPVLKVDTSDGVMFLNTDKILHITGLQKENKGFIIFGRDCHISLGDYEALVQIGNQWKEVHNGASSSTA
jgi:hypothetical protein